MSISFVSGCGSGFAPYIDDKRENAPGPKVTRWRWQGGVVARVLVLKRRQSLVSALKRRSKKLKSTAVESLTLSVEVFNRPSDVARSQGVLLHLQHAFEMLMKAIIWERRGRIQPPGTGKSYSFKKCLGILRSEVLLDDDEATVAATIDAERDAVQHQGAEVGMERLYVAAASGLRLFDDLLRRAFGETLAEQPGFGDRVLPVTARPPRELYLLTEGEVETIRDLLRPTKRRRADAYSYLRTLQAAEQAAQDPLTEVEQPTEKQLDAIGEQLRTNKDWTEVFPGLARLALGADEGRIYSLKVVKGGGDRVAPVRIVKPGDDGAADAVGIVKVDRLKSFPFNLPDLSSKLGVNRYEVQALVHLLGLKEREDCFSHFKVDRVAFTHYSHQALRELRQAINSGRVDEARAAYGEFQRRKRG